MSANAGAGPAGGVDEAWGARADVVGSLLRPPALLDARARWLGGDLDTHSYKQVEDRAVDEALALQESCGLDVVTDGEMRRMFFSGVITDAVEGIELTPGQTTVWQSGAAEAEALEIQLPAAVTGRVRFRRSLATEEFSYARGRTDRLIKVTLPSPTMFGYFWSPEKSTAAYREPFELFRDATQIIRQEVRELARLGCRYIQIDAPELVTLVDPTHADYFAHLGIDPERLLDEGVELVNACADHPDIHFVMHLCRGNNHGRWLAEGGYDAISRKVFGRATNFNGFALEYDSPRAGGFEALAEMPDDKRVILGLISTKVGTSPPLEELRGRIDQAARHFPREQLAISTQCGFASEQSGNPITAAEQTQKLRLVAELAHEVL
ncbi:MAG TPA: cobalamin-independent methionine synthase II family protein [Solirubrobacteraceae bacterium]|jgi:5-methyltetrahydropteroyltriglutamate--homocysteine methyltransferase|nr:cobalamin-independent methionine synthase II family protein [Solirubrobacteraceae bacterium]